MLALQQMSVAATAPPLHVPSSAPVKFLSLSTKSMKAAAAVVLQTSNNIPWHLDSEPSLLPSFTLRLPFGRGSSEMSPGQYEWSALRKGFPAWPDWECFSLSTGNVLVLQKAAAAHISPH